MSDDEKEGPKSSLSERNWVLWFAAIVLGAFLIFEFIEAFMDDPPTASAPTPAASAAPRASASAAPAASSAAPAASSATAEPPKAP